MKRVGSIKLLKMLPIVGFLAFFMVNALANYLTPIFPGFFQAEPSNRVVLYFVQFIFFLPILMILVPGIVLGIKMISNKTFRERILQKELKIDPKDEREVAIISYAAKRAFAVTHLTLWLLVVLYYPAEIIVGMVSAYNTGLFTTFMDHRTLIFLVIPLVLGSYVFHKHAGDLSEKEIGVNIKNVTPDKTSTNTKSVFIQSGLLIVVGFIIGIALMRSQQSVTQDPIEIRQMNKKYQELVKNEGEERAREDLIKWLKEQPNVFDAQFKNDSPYPGLKVWYASMPGGKGYLENSWQNLKNN